MKIIRKTLNVLNCMANDKEMTKKLICDPIPKDCVFGCKVAHWTICLVTSLALNRTLVFNRNDTEIQNFVKPLSETCLNSSGENRTVWDETDEKNSYQVMEMPVIAYMIRNDKYKTLIQLPPRIPEQLKSQLQTLSDEPYILFTGSLLRKKQ